jgi:putative pyoverdin transport system ATP-binding/permease protein
MNIIKFLFRNARGLAVLTSLTAIVSGACGIGLIAMVNAVLNRQGAFTPWMVAGFIALGLGRLVTTFVSQVFLAHFSQKAIADLRRGLVRKILAVPLRDFEKIGGPRFMVALTGDVMEVGQALLMIPLSAMNAALLLGGAVYLSWLSWKVAAGISALILAGEIVYRWFIRCGFHYLNLAREESDKLYGHFRALTEGVKELKLHRSRRARFLSEDIQVVTETFSRHNIAGEVRFILGQGWSQLIFFSLIGLLLFLVPSMQQISSRELTGYVLMALFLMGPLAGVLGSLSAFGRANVSLRKIDRLGLSLDAHVTEHCPLTESGEEARFTRLELRGITHSYHHEKDDSHFTIGPMDLVFEPGELVFIVGGNGSGKSTLAKIITGLYPPEAGEVRLDGRLIDDRNRDDYRQIFSVVFADFFLFDNLVGGDGAALDSRAQRYLAQLHLDHKVKVRDGHLSTIELSQGQRKRLALLAAYLEDRPFYLFDEWASDQDPQFKEIFYSQLLPELKARGKAVIVITHDDHYFASADRIIKLDYGQLVFEKQTDGKSINGEEDGKCFEPQQILPTEFRPALEN